MNTFQISATIQAYSYDELPEDYRELVDIAKKMTKAAYSPYSRFSVGAALRLADGTIVRGCNQENAAYPSGLCAERTAMFAASANHPGQAMRVLAIAAYTDGHFTKEPVSPCGGCRQVMVEFCSPEFPVYLVKSQQEVKCCELKELLPAAFESF